MAALGQAVGQQRDHPFDAAIPARRNRIPGRRNHGDPHRAPWFGEAVTKPGYPPGDKSSGWRGTPPGTGDSCPPVAAIGLPTPATLVPPTGPIVVLDLDLLLADLGGHPLLAGHGVLVEPDPLPGHDPLLDHRLLLTQDHLVL